jgi:hypothetical protein
MEATHHPLSHHLDSNLNPDVLEVSWKPGRLSPVEGSNNISLHFPTDLGRRLDGDGDHSWIHRPASQVKVLFLQIFVILPFFWLY